jgi:hypothetical protein
LPPACKFVTDQDLLHLQALATRIGYYEAVRSTFSFPHADLNHIKERAHYHYVNDASSFSDAYLLERSWIKGFEDVTRSHARFQFEIDLLIRDPILPKKPDNPK